MYGLKKNHLRRSYILRWLYAEEREMQGGREAPWALEEPGPGMVPGWDDGELGKRKTR